MRDKITTAVECLGIACVVAGVAWFSVPIGVIVAGVGLIVIGAFA